MRKIAIPTRDNKLVDHFGKWEFFKILSLDEKGELVQAEYVRSDQGNGCEVDFAQLLKHFGVELLVVGMMGQKAVEKVTKEGIEVIRGFSGDEDALLKMLNNGLLADHPKSCEHTGNHCSHD